ncbi:CpaF family protein [Vibrio europaeus]|uniref:CpaF family protein n=1 Tax=Vibrio europaeus TaxID=300876 RepID=A0A178J5H5_9VIBR|nr:CpaF family protein [Vibrio europaeus]MDC5705788.1 CpaF family protein [Vibrio europaeus]MDC5709198.1 CpaF family protein [Vibrio europaeus]MDC5713597.1 CpaF family protein [Vibrio europaeus]MDC5720317.1 CpaF family protein [Vibrio europaeus]MDC5723796.1 CpaF family protein [Vibrio europaeus]
MSAAKALYLDIRDRIYEALDTSAVENASKEQLRNQLTNGVDMLIEQKEQAIPAIMRRQFVSNLIDELTGLGPLQSLMDDEDVTDIMVNGPDAVFVERHGQVEHTDVSFVDDNQLRQIAQRIVSRVGRRVDEATPLADARLPDGSRVNVVINPISIDGTAISIRKFKKQSIGLPELVEFGAMSPQMAKVLMIASRCRCNILISGGTGSGKTTLLNGLSQYISEKERILTIEDAAELRLQQPHVLRLETRVAGTEGTGKITQRDLVINALRMRPDRIIIGECRGSEAFEMLQAMNTGHDGSMSTLHANTPRDALARVESMIMMANLSLPLEAIRRTIVSAVNIVIQANRLHDGSRKITSISEVVGLEGENVVLEEIFRFEPDERQVEGEKIAGRFVTPGLMQRSELAKKSRYFGLYEELMAAFR